MIKINLIYSKAYELERVQSTINDIVWLKKNNYRFSLPSGVNGLEKISKDKLNELIDSEYSEDDFKIAEHYILKDIDYIQKNISQIQSKLSNVNKLNIINIYLTKYGTGGSYNRPNNIIINLQAKPYEFLIKTVMHECVHLLIEDKIQKYNISHWQKERIVDLIMDKELNSRFKMQNIPTTLTKCVDMAVEEHYPNIDNILNAIKK